MGHTKKYKVGEIKQILEDIYSDLEIRNTVVPLFMSNSGMGKTYIIEEFMEEKGVYRPPLVLSQRMPYEVSGMSLVDKEKDADVVMNLGISSVNLSALQYDAKGYNKLYKAEVFIKVDYYRKENGIKKSFTVDGEYDFAVDIGGTITDANRYDAITKASDQAVSEVVSRIAVQSFK